MTDVIVTILIGLFPVLLVIGFVLLLQRRTGQTIRLLPFVFVLIAVAFVSAIAAGGGLSLPAPAVVVIGLAGGVFFGWFAFRSWRDTGWSVRTLLLAMGAALSLTDALLH